VKHELSSSNAPENRSLDERFAKRPRLRSRLLQIADLIDAAVAKGYTADEAEAQAIEQLRQLGQELLTEYAEETHREAVAEARGKNPKLIHYGKKKK
jgi:hypothetical protein